VVKQAVRGIWFVCPLLRPADSRPFSGFTPAKAKKSPLFPEGRRAAWTWICPAVRLLFCAGGTAKAGLRLPTAPTYDNLTITAGAGRAARTIMIRGLRGTAPILDYEMQIVALNETIWRPFLLRLAYRVFVGPSVRSPPDHRHNE